MELTQKETIDELLEALYTASEQGTPALEQLNQLSKVPFTQAHISLLHEAGFLVSTEEPLTMSAAGIERGRAVIRRHRLTDVLLYHVLGMKEHEQRERIACETEHTLLPEMMEGICTLLGHPSHSPDGEPIPPGECCLREAHSVDSAIVKLSRLKPGESGRVAYIKPKSHSRFERLNSFGLIPGTIVTLLMDRPAYIIKFEHTELALDLAAVDDIYVTKVSAEVPRSRKKREGRRSAWARFRTWVSKGK